MNEITNKLRQVARDLLEKGEVSYIIGWEKGTFCYQSPPVFITRPEDADRLVWDEFCTNNLAHYLLDDRYGQGKVGLVVKGCDSRGVNRLIQDKQLKRERVYLIGVPCPGVKDLELAAQVSGTESSGIPLDKKCQSCAHPNPVVSDIMLGDPVEPRGSGDRLAETAEIEAMGTEERYSFWARHYDRCIRCFACRNVCPACNCTECCFDDPNTGWLGKEVTRGQNQYYGLVRAFHVAGRCIECGECERVCPMNIPIMSLKRKMIKDINELFGEQEAGMDLDTLPPLGFYQTGDPEEFM